MGEKVTNNQLILVSFKRDNNSYLASVPLNQFLTSKNDLEADLKLIVKVYENSVAMMKKNLGDIEKWRSTKKPLPARLVWKLGDLIFKLTADLEIKGFQIDGVYEHLVRDLNVKRKWLEKVIILRRYILKESIIPQTLNWGYFEKGTRKKAEGILRGIVPR